ncbi:MAG: Bax inhibitor-1/YccA family protein [Candidatus Peregrinibacteria bacterium]|nr:Bax inhibitor-1/YccA family protein [Candidatus Peregrinibacteria bacterium]
MFENMNKSPYAAYPSAKLSPTFFGKVMLFFTFAIISSIAGIFVAIVFLFDYFMAVPGIMFAFFAAELILVFTARMWSTKVPLNRFLFALFTFISGITIAPLIAIVAASPAGLVILAKALIITAFVFTAVGILGYTTKMDLSGMRMFLFIALIGMIITGVVGIFLPWSNTFEMFYAGIGVLLFAGFTAYDFQKIKTYPEDRYIDAALHLYLDIFNLFLYVLRLLMALNRRN